MRNFLPAIVVAAFLSLCACSTYNLDVMTIPEGATVSWQQGGHIGQAPTSLSFQPDTKYMNNGCFQVQGVSAIWASGAKTNSESVIRLCSGARDYTLMLERQADAPGLEADLRVALLILQNRMTLQQIQEHYRMQGYEALGQGIGTLLSVPQQ